MNVLIGDPAGQKTFRGSILNGHNGTRALTKYATLVAQAKGKYKLYGCNLIMQMPSKVLLTYARTFVR